MSEWKLVPFLDVIEVSPKVSIPKGSLVTFVEMANVRTNNSRDPLCTELRPYTGGSKFCLNDTVIASIEPCLQHGKSFYATDIEIGAGSTEFLVFRNKEGVTDSRFVYYFMMRYEIREAMIRSMKGATGRQRVDADVFKTLKIRIPDLNIQEKISKCLWDYDSAIANARKQIELLEEAAMRLYREWFSDKKGEKFPLSKFIYFQEGPGIRNWQYVESNGVRFINIRCIKNGDVDISNANMISCSEAFGKYKHFQLQEGDIVMSCSGTLGRTAVIRKDHLPLCLNTSVIRFRPRLDDRDYSFIYCYLNSDDFLHAQKAMANGAAQLNFGPKHLNLIQLDLPKEDLRYAFNEQVAPMLAAKSKLHSQIRKLTEARDRLLPKLMSGEIDVMKGLRK